MTLQTVSREVDLMMDSMIDALKNKRLDQFFKDSDTFQKHLKVKPKEIESLTRESYQFCREKDWNRAIESLLYLILLEPKKQLHYLRFGALLMQRHQCQEALQILQIASYLQPNDPRPILYAADCFLELNRIQEAKTAFLTCMELCLNKPEHKTMYDMANRAMQDIRNL